MLLIAERAKYEQWLEELEAKKESTPTKVFDRVRQDYLTRLQSVMDQLRQHTATLREHAGNLMAKLRELEATEQETTDELTEAELRARVGEITTGEWDSTSRKAQREIAKLAEGQDVIVADLNRIREILGGESGESIEADNAPRSSADFDELAFLKSVVGQPAPAAPPETAKAARPSVPTPAAKVDKPAEPAPAPTATPAPQKPPEPPAAAAPNTAQPGGLAIEKEPTDDLKSKKSAVDTPLKVPVQSDNALGVRTSGIVEQPKTLKCAECGSMNYPSEWYCERCGAELAVM